MASKFQASGPFLRIGLGGVEQLPTLFTTATTKFRENLHAVHAQHIGQLDRIAHAMFVGSKIRGGETGERSGTRETGNFTFGGANSAFQGRLMEKGDTFGFGWPDVDRADQATNFVWRSLEFGLRGTRHGPTARFRETIAGGNVFPQGWHQLPRAFYFEGGGPSTSRMVLGRGGGRQARAMAQGPKKKMHGYDKTMGAGIGGKHFLEDAWFAARIGNPQNYRSVVQKSFHAFR